MVICPGLLEIIKTQIQWVFFKMYLFMAHVAINNLIRDFMPIHHDSPGTSKVVTAQFKVCSSVYGFSVINVISIVHLFCHNGL